MICIERAYIYAARLSASKMMARIQKRHRRRKSTGSDNPNLSLVKKKRTAVTKRLCRNIMLI